ncbi:hypothetical protein [Burkholderia ambifaria]|uniref:hypothetical protein n=1 Tax=Burkholderia ambifaria TaxID=152480 RepID=UPI00158E1C92|nr:hypothetical protein [Burkholderia ambifaria]
MNDYDRYVVQLTNFYMTYLGTITVFVMLFELVRRLALAYGAFSFIRSSGWRAVAEYELALLAGVQGVLVLTLLFNIGE